jgi:hypothetical protein
MARDGSGTAEKAVSDFVTGTTASATDMNTLIDDIINMLTQSISKDGQTVWTGADDHNGQEIILDADADTSITADTDDQIDVKVGGTDRFRFTNEGLVGASTAKFHRTVTTGITAGTTQTQAGATALTTEFNFIGTCATSGDGVKLPTAVAGLEVTVYNGGAEPAQVWPATDDKINGGSADAVDANLLLAGAFRTYRAKDGVDWFQVRDKTLSLASGATVTAILDEDDMASDSATAIPTQQSVKAYVDANAVGLTLGTPVASTSGTAIDFTGIPSGTKRITVNFSGVSTSGTDFILFQLGDAGGFETSGYVSVSDRGLAQTTTSTAGFVLRIGGTTNTYRGSLTLTLLDASTFTWVGAGLFNEASNSLRTSGEKSLSAELTQIRITTTGGTDTFDAGSINITTE